MAVRNAERYLPLAVGSVLGQTFDDFELLMIEDGSTDGTFEIISSYDDRRIRYLRNPVRRGAEFSRQRGLEAARGEYVAILDADDVAFPDRLDVQAAYLDAVPDVQLLGGACEVIDSEGRVEDTVVFPTDPLVIRWNLLFGNCIAHSTVMFRRDVALRIGGYNSLRSGCDDFDLWVRFAARGRIAQIDRPLVQYRRHGGSVSDVLSEEIRGHLPWIVSESIQLQTGLSVPLEVARALVRHGSRRAPSRDVLGKAYRVIVQCLERSLESVGATDERGRLVVLACEEISLLGRENRFAWPLGVMAIVKCLRENAYRNCLSEKIIRAIVRCIPSVQVFRRLSRPRH